MSTRESTDVLVVGLGPAGACAAREAARKGVRVIALDRKEVAGQPVQCAEFVPSLMGQQVEGLDAVAHQPIASMTTFVEMAERHVQPQFPGVMIARDAFDASLVAQAREAGADCRLGCLVRSLDAAGDVVLGDGHTISAKVVVGADGPRSRVGAAIGQVNREIAETRQITVPLLHPFSATDIFLAAGIPGGYAWLFPKGGQANLGLGVAQEHRQLLKPLLDALHEALVAEGRVGRGVLATTGGAIPVGGMLEVAGRIGPVQVLLAGDAGGFTNPVTGAGINAAVLTGEMAGAAAARVATGDLEAGADYADEAGDLFRSSLERALRRRRELMQTYGSGQAPTAADLKRGWIAFEEYWH